MDYGQQVRQGQEIQRVCRSDRKAMDMDIKGLRHQKLQDTLLLRREEGGKASRQEVQKEAQQQTALMVLERQLQGISRKDQKSYMINNKVTAGQENKTVQERGGTDMTDIHQYNTRQMHSFCKDHLSRMVSNQDMIQKTASQTFYYQRPGPKKLVRNNFGLASQF